MHVARMRELMLSQWAADQPSYKRVRPLFWMVPLDYTYQSLPALGPHVQVTGEPQNFLAALTFSTFKPLQIKCWEFCELGKNAVSCCLCSQIVTPLGWDIFYGINGANFSFLWNVGHFISMDPFVSRLGKFSILQLIYSLHVMKE